MNQKGFINIAVMVLTIVVVSAAGYFYWSKKIAPPIEQISAPASAPSPAPMPQTNIPSSQTPTPLPTQISNTQPAPTQVTSEITNWKIYRNEKYGFEVKYPVDFDISRFDDWEKPEGLFSAIFNSKQFPATQVIKPYIGIWGYNKGTFSREKIVAKEINKSLPYELKQQSEVNTPRIANKLIFENRLDNNIWPSGKIVVINDEIVYVFVWWGDSSYESIVDSMFEHLTLF